MGAWVIVDYHRTIADKGKQTCFPFPFAANKRKFAVSSKQVEVATFR
jgi:hypothetical protein